jgi:hypothetical protein
VRKTNGRRNRRTDDMSFAVDCLLIVVNSEGSIKLNFKIFLSLLKVEKHPKNYTSL